MRDNIYIDRELLKIVGLKAAAMYAELLDRADGDDFFPATIDYIESAVFLSRKQQTKAIKTLTELGLIECKVMGQPAQRHFKILRGESWKNDITGLS